MLNKVMIIGRLGRDPEMRYTSSGAPITTLNIATDESYVDRDGNKVERTEWHRVSVFQRQAENCANYLTKGSLVYVEGSLQTRKWQDQQGQDRYTTEIKAQRVQFLDRKSDRLQGPPQDDYQGYGQRPRPQGRPSPHEGQRGAPYQSPYDSQPASHYQPQPPDEDLGPAFPSEATNMGSSKQDNVPF